jgi:hypothetical protein
MTLVVFLSVVTSYGLQRRYSTFQRWTLKMGIACFSGTYPEYGDSMFVRNYGRLSTRSHGVTTQKKMIYRTVRRHTPEDRNNRFSSLFFASFPFYFLFIFFSFRSFLFYSWCTFSAFSSSSILRCSLCLSAVAILGRKFSRTQASYRESQIGFCSYSQVG